MIKSFALTVILIAVAFSIIAGIAYSTIEYQRSNERIITACVSNNGQWIFNSCIKGSNQ